MSLKGLDHWRVVFDTAIAAIEQIPFASLGTTPFKSYSEQLKDRKLSHSFQTLTDRLSALEQAREIPPDVLPRICEELGFDPQVAIQAFKSLIKNILQQAIDQDPENALLIYRQRLAERYYYLKFYGLYEREETYPLPLDDVFVEPNAAWSWSYIKSFPELGRYSLNNLLVGTDVFTTPSDQSLKSFERAVANDFDFAKYIVSTSKSLRKSLESSINTTDFFSNSDILIGNASTHAFENLANLFGEKQAFVGNFSIASHIVLLGGPGTGKTTLVRWLARAIAKQDSELISSIKLPQNSFPIVVSVAGYGKARSANVNLTMRGYIENQLYDLLGHSLVAAFQIALDNSAAFILFDGLDEIPDLGERVAASERIQEFMNDLGDNKCLVTSRPVGYSECRFARKIPHFELEGFDTSQVKKFSRAWHLALERIMSPNAPDYNRAISEADSLFEEATHESVRDMLRNPLMLTLAAILRRGSIKLPDRRVEFYDRVLSKLIGTWNKVRSEAGFTIGKELRAREIEEAWAPVAYWMHAKRPEGHAYRREVEDQLVSAMQDRLDLDRLSAQRTSADYLKTAIEQIGLVSPVGEDYLAFAHRTFQEYLAAQEVGLNPGETPDRVLELAPDPNWHEVIRLAVGYLEAMCRNKPAASQVLIKLVENPWPVALLTGDHIDLALDMFEDKVRFNQDAQQAFVRALFDRDNAAPCFVDDSFRLGAETRILETISKLRLSNNIGRELWDRRKSSIAQSDIYWAALSRVDTLPINCVERMISDLENEDLTSYKSMVGTKDIRDKPWYGAELKIVYRAIIAAKSLKWNNNVRDVLLYGMAAYSFPEKASEITAHRCAEAISYNYELPDFLEDLLSRNIFRPTLRAISFLGTIRSYAEWARETLFKYLEHPSDEVRMIAFQCASNCSPFHKEYQRWIEKNIFGEMDSRIAKDALLRIHKISSDTQWIKDHILIFCEILDQQKQDMYIPTNIFSVLDTQERIEIGRRLTKYRSAALRMVGLRLLAENNPEEPGLLDQIVGFIPQTNWKRTEAARLATDTLFETTLGIPGQSEAARRCLEKLQMPRFALFTPMDEAMHAAYVDYLIKKTQADDLDEVYNALSELSDLNELGETQLHQAIEIAIKDIVIKNEMKSDNNPVGKGHYRGYLLEDMIRRVDIHIPNYLDEMLKLCNLAVAPEQQAGLKGLITQVISGPPLDMLRARELRRLLDSSEESDGYVAFVKRLLRIAIEKCLH